MLEQRAGVSLKHIPFRGKAPAQVLTKLGTAIRATLANTAIQQKLRGLGAVVVASTPTDYREWLKQDHERWTPLIKDAGVKAK